MLITIKESKDYMGCPRERLLINGREKACVNSLCECPEDAIIGRSLISCSQIAEFMRLAWNAAVQGEAFNLTKEPDDEEE
jgi:hypothetical protein